MEDYNNPVFAQAKIEYTKQLQDVLMNPIYEGLQSIYGESKKEYSNYTDIPMYQIFRKKIETVPKWNTDMIDDEGTNAMMSDYIREQEKLVWMYSSFMKDPEI